MISPNGTEFSRHVDNGRQQRRFTRQLTYYTGLSLYLYNSLNRRNWIITPSCYI